VNLEINNLGVLGDSEIVEWFVKLPTNIAGKEQNKLFIEQNKLFIEARYPRTVICTYELYI
jgi:hypothetical protein